MVKTNATTTSASRRDNCNNNHIPRPPKYNHWRLPHHPACDFALNMFWFLCSVERRFSTYRNDDTCARLWNKCVCLCVCFGDEFHRTARHTATIAAGQWRAAPRSRFFPISALHTIHEHVRFCCRFVELGTPCTRDNWKRFFAGRSFSNLI